MERKWLSADDIAEYLGVKKGTLYRWIRERGLPAHRLGKLLRFRREEVDAWVERQGEEMRGGIDREKILRLLFEKREEIKKRFAVTRIGIFGSAARGEGGPSSDVDVLVEFERVSFDAYMDLKFYLEDLFGRRVDLVIASDLRPGLREKVMEEAAFAEGF